MAFQLTLPENYNYVLTIALAAIPTLNAVYYATCGHFRHGSGVPYPHSYATPEQCSKSPAAFKFNCAQRAQANFNEHAPYVIMQLLAAGLQYPLVASGMGAGWVVFRGLYLYGYVKRGPKGRLIGVYHSLFEAGLLLLSLWSGYKLVTS